MAQDLNQVPPGLEVWSYGKQIYLVKLNDQVQPPVPMVWKVEDADRKAALGIKKIDRMFSSSNEFWSTGAINFGGSIELWNIDTDPLDTLYANWEAEVQVKPYLQDPEILTLFMQAAMENRDVSDAELQTTDWWRTHSQTERQWISTNAADPATANNLIRDNRFQVAELFEQAGISNATQGLIQNVADRWTTGAWTQIYAINQIKLLADPNLEGTLDPALNVFSGKLDTTREGEDDVRNMIQTWLGPAAAKDWSQESIDQWASRMREDPDARIMLTDTLKKHRSALFPEYTNAELTYEDIAAPWRGVWSGIMGGVADELNPLFSKIVRMNDRAQAESVLRKEGLRQGNSTVAQGLLSDLNGAFGGQIRRSDPAVL